MNAAVATLLPVASLLVAATILTAGNGLLSTLVSFRMSLERFPLELSGAVMSAYFVGLVGGSIVGGRLIERVGHIRAFAAFAALLTASALLQALFVAPLPWLACRVVTGFCAAGELMVAESWLNACATNLNRGRIFSVYMSAIFVSFGGGQFLLNMRDPAGPEVFVVAAFLLAVSIVPVALTGSMPPASVGSARLRLRELWHGAPLALAGSFGAGVAIGAVQALGPRFAGDLGFSGFGVSQLMGAIFLSGILLQFPVGRLSDRWDRRSMLSIMSLLSALAATAMALVVGEAFSLLLGFGALFGGTAATVYPLSVAFANDRIRSQSVVAISGGLLLANGVGAILGPLLGATTMRVLGPAGLFHFVAAVSLSLAAYAAYRIRFFAPVPVEEQEAFVPLGQTTPAATTLDPRAPSAVMPEAITRAVE